MDHPALEVVETEPLTAVQLGGVNARCFERPVPVVLIAGERRIAARVVERRTEETRVTLALEADESVPTGAFGVFDVGPFREDGALLRGPAMDDLGGCASILAALAACRQRGVDTDLRGVFTRAEEVGLTGATLLARERVLPPETLMVSLEASREVPGATIGGGPVIRVGDRTSAFHPAGDALLQRAAQRLAERPAPVQVQRQLMAGGTCEATAFTVFDQMATGVALPLGNYHNCSADFTIEAEYISRNDLLGAVELLVAAVEASTTKVEPSPVRTRLTTRADGLAVRLRESAAGWRLEG